MKSLFQKLLAWKARKIIQKYQPKVVGITGSVGKTSTRNAIATVLRAKYRVRTNIENYNNEFGVPFTIIGMKSPGRSIFGWLKLFWKADKLILFRDQNYPNMLVLEYGVEHPGDIDYLCDIALPDVGVLTAISPVHVEYFDGLEGLKKEKGRILERAKELVVLNLNDEHVLSMKDRADVRVETYGISAGDVHAENVNVETRDDFSFEPGEQFSAMHFDLHVHDDRAQAELRDLLGMGQVSAALAGAAVGAHFGVETRDIVTRLTELQPQAGRMRPIPGIKGSLILDDSYNAAPASTKAAIETLMQFHPAEASRRIAAIGKMAELGDLTEQEHRLIGLQLAAGGVDFLVTVGEEAQDIRRGAIEGGIPESQTRHFEDSVEAGRFLDGEVKKGDVVLVKGSQSARMEMVVRDLMAEPLMAGKLLVRQYGKWLEDYL